MLGESMPLVAFLAIGNCLDELESIVGKIDAILIARHIVASFARNSLAADDIGGVDAFGGISCVDQQLRLFGECAVVVAGVVRDDDDGVVLAKVVKRGAGHVQVVVAASTNSGEVGVVICDDGALDNLGQY